ncbi:MAG: PAS domain S-box protein [Deltaproteobacteria bacterium]|nr:MAG: PAS domain S-box protein [Deltaproteobacteria bacterium]
MKDEEKTKEQLMNELVEMRLRIAELERSETEHKQAEKVMMETNLFLKNILDSSSSISIISTDLERNILFWNKGAEDMFGYKAQEVVGRHKIDILYPDDEPDTKGTVEEVRSFIVKDKKGINCEIKEVTKDGQKLWISLTSTPRFDETGHVMGILGIGEDITERKRAEDELRQQALIVETIHDGIIVTDLESRIIDWNSAAEKMFGYGKNEMVGKTTGVLTTSVVAATIRDGRWSGEISFIRKDGTDGVCETVVVPLRDEHDNVVATVGVNRDISERKRTAEELQQSLEKLKRILEETVNALASAVETRDPYTAGHQNRVASLSCAIAREMGFSRERLEGIHIAAIIHDVGKMYIPAEILSRPGRLTEIEFDIIKTHPQIGYDVLKAIEFSWPVAQMVHQHHERMDGSGYPAGLPGEEMLLESKILAVADVVEAMASHRPYRPAHDIGDALEEISQKRGVLYDSEVVDVCLRLFAEKDFELQ